jgi:muramoyltetrapeptide carboxypeptidase LdcA involved in peptidoglycan recycling
MRHTYAIEKLSAAKSILSSRKGDIRSRLLDAYLKFHTLSEDDFPEDLKDDWLYVHNGLTSEKPTIDSQGEVISGKLQNTLKIIDEDICNKIVSRILFLETQLRHLRKTSTNR